MPLPDVVDKLKAIAANNPDRRIFVRGDKDLPYGRIMELMGIITQGGFTHVALLAEQTGPHRSGAPSSLSPAPPGPETGPSWAGLTGGPMLQRTPPVLTAPVRRFLAAIRACAPAAIVSLLGHLLVILALLITSPVGRPSRRKNPTPRSK